MASAVRSMVAAITESVERGRRGSMEQSSVGRTVMCLIGCTEKSPIGVFGGINVWDGFVESGEKDMAVAVVTGWLYIAC